MRGLRSVTIGVPDAPAAADYYTEFGLSPSEDGWFRSRTGARQLRLVETGYRRLVQVVISGDQDDVVAAERRLREAGFAYRRDDLAVTALDPPSGVEIVVEADGPVHVPDSERNPVNSLSRAERVNRRAASLDRSGAGDVVRLGHVVLGSPNAESSTGLLTGCFGLRISDIVGGALFFLRCSTEHHNILVMQSAVPFLHHTAWEVPDVDEVGRAGSQMVNADPRRQVWGFGRHHVGSNYFWYLKDPAGNFTEYFADMDCITDADAWQAERLRPEQIRDWPRPPRQFIRPDDLAAIAEAQAR